MPLARAALTREGRVFRLVATTAALAVGAMQMYHVHGGILTDYGADMFGTAWVYSMARAGGMLMQRGRAASARNTACVVFLLCLAWELGQKAHLVPGRYDAFDIATYCVTLAVCWAIDRRWPFVQAG
jgi:hypothetical protein